LGERYRGERKENEKMRATEILMEEHRGVREKYLSLAERLEKKVDV